MGRVAKKVLMSKPAGGVVSTALTKGVIMGTNDATGIDIETLGSMSFENNVVNSALNIGYDSSVDASRALAFFCNPIADTLACVDFSDVTNVSVVDTIVDSTNLDFTRGVKVDSANEVVFATGQSPNAFNAIDYSTPSSLSIISTLTLAVTPDRIELDVARDTAYVKAGGRILSINISNTSSMSVRETYINSSVVNTAGGLAIDTGRNLLFGSSFSGDNIAVFNTSNVAAIALISNLSDGTNLNQITNITVDKDKELAFCLGLDLLSVVDYSNTSSLSIEDTVSNTAFGGGSSRSVRIDPARELVFIAARSETPNVFVYDYSDPTSLTLTETITGTSATTNGGMLVLAN